MLDLYDKAIQYLESRPDDIITVWDDPKSSPAGILFLAASPTGDAERREDGDICGDICEIAADLGAAYSKDIEIIIKMDERIPHFDANGIPSIKLEDLNVFAELQRLFDLAWNRNPLNKLHEWGFEPASFSGE